MRDRAATLLCAWGSALALGACGGAGDPPAIPAPTTCPIASAVAQPTFAGHVLPALRASCGSGTTTCHGGTQGTAAGHVSYDPALSAAAVHGSLVGQVPASAPAGTLLVAPSDRAHSWLLTKVTQDAPGGGGGYGKRMPQGEAPLCAATLTTLESWIDQGAPLGP
jgi:hypothetical protein